VSENLLFDWVRLININEVLRNRLDSGGQNTKKSCGRNGPPPRQPRYHVRLLLFLISLRLTVFPRNLNKVRIIALYIQHRDGVPDEDRRRLYQHARLTLPEQDAINALIHLGVKISKVRPFGTTSDLVIYIPSAESQ
jgi:hypothetical protein